MPNKTIEKQAISFYDNGHFLLFKPFKNIQYIVFRSDPNRGSEDPPA